MKKCYYILVPILIATSAFSQENKEPLLTNTTPPDNERWSLDKYLWNHAKNKTGRHNNPKIDYNAIENWQELGSYLSVSNDGKYFAYTIERGVGFSGVGLSFPYRKVDSLIIQSTGDFWHLAFPETIPGFFTSDSKQYVFQTKDTLCFLQLDRSQPQFARDVVSFKLLDNGIDQWLIYQLKSGQSNVVLRNLLTGKEKRFSFVVGYLFAKRGQALVFKTVEKTSSGPVTALKYVCLPEGTEKLIWSTLQDNLTISSYNIDDDGKQVVFSIQSRSDSIPANVNLPNNTIWYYQKGMDNAMLKVTSETDGIDARLQIAGPVSFTDNGHYIKFFLQPRPFNDKPVPDVAQLYVWNHKDLMLQSAQSNLLKRPKTYNAIVSVKNPQVLQLETEGKRLYLLQSDFAIISKPSKETYGDRFWEEGYNEDSTWLVSLKDRSRHLLPTKGGGSTLWFSPGGNYLVYFDAERGCHYFSYNLRNGELKKISANVPDGQLGYVDPFLRTVKKPRIPVGVAAWLENDEGILVYDDYDIWKLDLTGKRQPINVTNGYGRSHSIKFSLFNSQRFAFSAPVLKQKGPLLLSAFSTKSKYSGFYRKSIDANGQPELLYMGSYFIYKIAGCQDPNLTKQGMQPIKARDADIWIVQRQSTNDAPNYYKTTDLRSFERLTNYQPQKAYSWLSGELHSFKHLNGKSGQGILYKPENFDPSKKYPVLIVFYGGYSNSLYQFPVPRYNWSAITPGVSPIWFLNNGYLVFTPDIYVAPLKHGPEAFNVIEGAASYLKQLPYVNPDKLGCSSHSWSAKLGSYIFTHSKSFAAMTISEGFLYANMINVALSTDKNGISKLENVENNFHYGSFWENKDTWLDQTTVLNVDKAKAPMLLYCNHNDPNLDEYANQTLQLFTALRRLEKKVWWLQYDKGEHTIDDLSEQKDYTIRYTQFFNHYLKDAPAPRWMTQGIRVAMKGVETGFELDAAGSCELPGKNECNICKKWNERHKKFPEMFRKPVSEWELDEGT